MSQPGFEIAVCGLHLRGQPLNKQLTDLGADFKRTCRSKAAYRLFAITDQEGLVKPGMVRCLSSHGLQPLDLEVWELPLENVGAFMTKIPPPLAIGTLEMDDGASIKGFVCEAVVVEAYSAGDRNVADISHFGGWLNYLSR